MKNIGKIQHLHSTKNERTIRPLRTFSRKQSDRQSTLCIVNS